MSSGPVENYPFFLSLSFRFAPHLEKCMGMGRNSSRLASRRLATSSKDPCYRESGGQEDEDDAEDEDWVEPSSAIHHQRGVGAHYGGHAGLAQGGGGGNGRRKREKHSPRRNRGMRAGVRESAAVMALLATSSPQPSLSRLSPAARPPLRRAPSPRPPATTS